MGQNSRQILLFFFASLFVFVYAVRREQAQIWQTAQSASYGRYTADQILQRSESLFHAFFPERNDLTMLAERQATNESEPDARLLWAVDCTDATGHHPNLCWDARTGELVYASRIREESAAERDLLRKDTERIRRAQGWLYTLGIAGNTEPWRFLGVRLAPPSNLHVYWRSAHRSAVVVVDGRSGDFISATSGRQALGQAQM